MAKSKEDEEVKKASLDLIRRLENVISDIHAGMVSEAQIRGAIAILCEFQIDSLKRFLSKEFGDKTDA